MNVPIVNTPISYVHELLNNSVKFHFNFDYVKFVLPELCVDTVHVTDLLWY